MLAKESWSPYVAGSAAGLLLAGSAWLSKRTFGSATTFVRTAGMVQQQVAPTRVKKSPYFQEITPTVDWQTTFLAGIGLGAFVSALSSGSFKVQGVPEMWANRFGNNPLKRGIAAFSGGVIAMMGARLAGGCPSGHLSGFVQLSVGSLTSLVSFFVGGAITSRLLYGKGGQ